MKPRHFAAIASSSMEPRRAIRSRLWLVVPMLVLAMIACSGEGYLPPLGGTGSATGTGGAGGAGAGEMGGAGSTGGEGGGGGEGGEGGEGGAAPTGSVIVGVTSELGAADIITLHVIMRVNGAVVNWLAYGSAGTPPITFPLELPFSDLPEGDEVEVELTATNPWDDPLLLPQERRVKTTIVAGKTLLMRLDLRWSCSPWDPGDPFAYCDPPLTCIWGSCHDAYVPPAALETYSPGWASYSYCKPEGAGAPTVLLGTGSADYAPINDFDVLTVTTLGQGGYHVWVALRMKNLRQTSFVTLTGHVPDLGLDLGPFTFPINFPENMAAGYCEEAGIIFPLDSSNDILDLLGMGMEMSAQITDEDGSTAQDVKTIAISENINQR